MLALSFFAIAVVFTLPLENVSATTFYGSPATTTTTTNSRSTTPATLDAVVYVKAAYETGMVEKMKQVTDMFFIDP